MAFPFLPVGLALSGASVLGSLINSFKTPQMMSEDDLNRLFELQLNRALADESVSARRQLAAAGLGGSGVINQIIQDQRSRIRASFEEQREKALANLRQMQFQRDTTAQQNRANILGNLAGLGFGIAQMGMKNPFQGYLEQLQSLQGNISPNVQINSGQLPGMTFDPRKAFDGNVDPSLSGFA